MLETIFITWHSIIYGLLGVCPVLNCSPGRRSRSYRKRANNWEWSSNKRASSPICECDLFIVKGRDFNKWSHRKCLSFKSSSWLWSWNLPWRIGRHMLLPPRNFHETLSNVLKSPGSRFHYMDNVHRRPQLSSVACQEHTNIVEHRI